jgi:hypothetical protein
MGSNWNLKSDPSYPDVFLLGTGLLKTNIWAPQQYFWPKARIEVWDKAILYQGTFAEVCYNLLYLSPSAHRYHGKGYFALKPVSMSTARGSEMFDRYNCLASSGFTSNAL